MNWQEKLLAENIKLKTRVDNLTLFIDHVRIIEPGLFGAMMDEFDGMPGYVSPLDEGRRDE